MKIQNINYFKKLLSNNDNKLQAFSSFSNDLGVC